MTARVIWSRGLANAVSSTCMQHSLSSLRPFFLWFKFLGLQCQGDWLIYILNFVKATYTQSSNPTNRSPLAEGARKGGRCRARFGQIHY